MFLDELAWQREVLGGLSPTFLTNSAIEEVYVQEDDYQVVEGTEGFLLDRKRAIAVRLIATLDLHTDRTCRLLRIRMNTNQVVTLVVWRRFVRKNVPAHQLADHQVFCAERDDWESEGILIAHFCAPYDALAQ